MLSWRFLHLRSSKAGVLDAVLDAYAADSATPFAEWVGLGLRPDGPPFRRLTRERVRIALRGPAKSGMLRSGDLIGRRAMTARPLPIALLLAAVGASGAAAQDMPGDVSASGNEPFWRVEIEGEHLRADAPRFRSAVSVGDRAADTRGWHPCDHLRLVEPRPPGVSEPRCGPLQRYHGRPDLSLHRGACIG